MTAKEIVIERTREFPDEATLDEIVEELQILAAIERGQRAADEGRVVPHSEVRQRFAEWRTK